ncbi:hypothetical protein B0H34DRAFT_801189 [Crassisporium funariophilum]|nr:hypothetical protein B0H34DRAFT_801189 [Crassisporium funariophilum]
MPLSPPSLSQQPEQVLRVLIDLITSLIVKYVYPDLVNMNTHIVGFCLDMNQMRRILHIVKGSPLNVIHLPLEHGEFIDGYEFHYARDWSDKSGRYYWKVILIVASSESPEGISLRKWVTSKWTYKVINWLVNHGVPEAEYMDLYRGDQRIRVPLEVDQSGDRTPTSRRDLAPID